MPIHRLKELDGFNLSSLFSCSDFTKKGVATFQDEKKDGKWNIVNCELKPMLLDY